jgi:hypothetical protein
VLHEVVGAKSTCPTEHINYVYKHTAINIPQIESKIDNLSNKYWINPAIYKKKNRSA